MSEEEQFTKPSYDGRLKYFDVIKEYLSHISLSSLQGDFKGWARLLNGLFALVQPFIRTEDKDKIRTKLSEIRKDLQNTVTIRDERSKKIIMNKLDNKLQDTTELIYSASKHLLLPTDTEESIELSEKSFMEDSDL